MTGSIGSWPLGRLGQLGFLGWCCGRAENPENQIGGDTYVQVRTYFKAWRVAWCRWLSHLTVEKIN